MRNTLITGMLLCLPTAVLLASVSLALLAGGLRGRLRRGRFSDLAAARPGQEGLHDDTTAALSPPCALRLPAPRLPFTCAVPGGHLTVIRAVPYG